MTELGLIQEALREIYGRISDIEAMGLVSQNLKEIRRRIGRGQEKHPIFWEPRGFFGNSKYLFLAWEEHSRKTNSPRPVWLTGSRDTYHVLASGGYEVILWKHSQTKFEDFKRLISGSALFCTSVDYLPPMGIALLFEIFRGKPVIQLWHGIATKDLTFNWPSMDVTTFASALNVVQTPTHLLIPQRIRDLESYFGKPKLIKASSPRNWPLLSLATEDTSKSKAQPLEGDAVVLYAPTFSTQRDELLQAEIAKKLSHIAGSRGLKLQVKPHPDHGDVFIEALNSIGIDVLPRDSDLQVSMVYAAVLITDISSAAIDFLLTNKPIVFTLWEELEIVRTNSYVFRSRKIPGIVSLGIQDLTVSIEKALDGDQLSVSRVAAAKKFHGTKHVSPQKLIKRLRFEISLHKLKQKLSGS